MNESTALETVNFVQKVTTDHRRNNPQEWTDQLESRHLRILKAYQILLTGRRFDAAMSLLTLMTPFWRFRGQTEIACTLCEQFLTAQEENTPSIPRARVLILAAVLALDTSDIGKADAFASEGLRLSRELNDEKGLGRAYIAKAKVAFEREDPEAARSLCGECLTFQRNRGEEPAAGIALHGLGEAERLAGNYRKAGDLYEKSLAIGQKHRNMNIESLDLHNLGYVKLHLGHARKAKTLFKESLAIARSIGNQTTVASCVIGLAAVETTIGNTVLAARLFAAGKSHLNTLGISLDRLDEIEYEKYTEQLRDKIGGEAFDRAVSVEGGTELSDVLDLLEAES